ncbi:LAS seventeen-binding protein 3 [Desulfofundulus thermocisternus]|uniref:LAS seventeen-binding protein 3 n=1 Tax=Desulfofundulus thermocisternus TaxID=42471 RepID=UPI00217E7244|nr:LAS seventeen-binding protein 3 [Desulfofundulus thermocisternus]MCS5695863.1 LAS seventeen-binding protein 3 [Desulfofundulus thermocisternus]
MDKEKERQKQPFARGDAFIPEATGSAIMINLDGQWEHDFADDPTPFSRKNSPGKVNAGKNPKNNGSPEV